jgi:hypothetical protein
MSFYGVDEDDLKKVYEAVLEIQNRYRKHERTMFAGDNLLALMRNLSFTKDGQFMDAFRKNDLDGTEEQKMWRLHTYCWAGRSALSVPGDFVECGVYKGFYSAVLADYLDFGSSEKQLYLYDTFAGLHEEWATEVERSALNPVYEWDGTYEAVLERFAKYPNVHVVKGVVPEIFAQSSPERIALLHVDLNAAAAEVAALEALFDRISGGGLVLLDDFGRQESILLHAALSDWWRHKGYPVLELPTGQGLVIKRSG